MTYGRALVGLSLCLFLAYGPRAHAFDAPAGTARIEYLVDDSHTHTVDSVASATFTDARTLPTFPNFGFTDATVWFRITPDPALRSQSVVFVVDHIYLNDAVLYGPQGSPFKFGLDVPFGAQELPYYGYAVPFRLADKALSTPLLLRVRSKFPLSLPFTLVSKQAFYEEVRVLDRLFWFYLGVILLLVGYNAFVFVVSGERAYLLYVATLLALHLFANTAQYGLVRWKLFPEWTFFHSNVFYFSHLFSTLTMFLFASAFFRLREGLPRMRRVLLVPVVVNAALLVTGLVVQRAWVDSVNQLNSSIFALLLLGASAIAAFRGDRQARFFAVAWFCLIVFWVITFLRIDGVVSRNLFTQYAILFGGMLEGVLLSLALAERLRSLRHEKENAERRAIDSAARAEIARQVAHDIRSPIAALECSVAEVSTFSVSLGRILQEASRRIREIAEDLIERETGSTPMLQRIPLAPCAKELLDEKRAQYRERVGIRFEIVVAPDAHTAAVEVHPAEWKRVLSNLLDNAVEAIRDAGTVRVSLDQDEHWVTFVISDNGRGIAPEVLARLGSSRISVGKRRGMGLGVRHAMTTLQSWKGSLQFESTLEVGTRATVRLPRAAAPVEVTPTPSRLVAAPKGELVLLDGDVLVHEVWKHAASAAGYQLHGYHSRADLWRDKARFDKDTVFCLDYAIEPGVRGTDVARALVSEGFTELYLVTGYPADHFGDVRDVFRGILGKEFPFPAKADA